MDSTARELVTAVTVCYYYSSGFGNLTLAREAIYFSSVRRKILNFHLATSPWKIDKVKPIKKDFHPFGLSSPLAHEN
jgi:hypothetical protein